MARRIEGPTLVEAVGNKPKKIEEFLGRVNSGDAEISVARMKSPSGWIEPPQTPEFREITLVLAGMLRVEFAGGVLEAGPGQTLITEAGERVQYGTPGPEGAEYIAICLPAFAPDLAHRDP